MADKQSLWFCKNSPFVLPNSSVDVLSQEGMLPANNPVWWSREFGSSRGM